MSVLAEVFDAAPLGAALDDGAIVIWVPCEGARLKELTVVEDPGSTSLWKVRLGSSAQHRREIVLGEVPPGGHEKIPFVGIGSGAVTVFAMAEDRLGYRVEFDPSVLEEGRILIDGRFLGPEEFERTADQRFCP